MAEIPFTPEQEAALREMCGLKPWDRPFTAAMILTMWDVRQILDAEAARILGEPWP